MKEPQEVALAIIKAPNLEFRVPVHEVRSLCETDKY